MTPEITLWGVLIASLAGSGHCVAMCGGLATSVVHSVQGSISYQIGRLIGYLALGALGGALGLVLLKAIPEGPLLFLSTAIIAVMMIAMGIRSWTGRTPTLFAFSPRWVKRVFGVAGGSPALTGLFSVFLPCGWLHAYVLAALSTGSILMGTLILLVFWLGTVPAMVAAPVLVRRVLAPLSARAPRVVGAIFILIGLATLGTRVPFCGSAQHEPQHQHHHHH